jgi:hypothetical protein
MSARCLALAVLAAGLGGCYGPNHLMRGLDQWGNQLYVDDPWLAQLATYTGVLSIGYVVAGFIDYVFVNPFDFWGCAVPSGHGTPHLYQQPMNADPPPPPHSLYHP